MICCAWQFKHTLIAILQGLAVSNTSNDVIRLGMDIIMVIERIGNINISKLWAEYSQLSRNNVIMKH